MATGWAGGGNGDKAVQELSDQVLDRPSTKSLKSPWMTVGWSGGKGVSQVFRECAGWQGGQRDGSDKDPSLPENGRVRKACPQGKLGPMRGRELVSG